MKLSEQSLNVLKNFASINSGMVIRDGNIQKTISPEQTILAEATLPDNFPVEFGVYDLNQFLGNINTLNNPSLNFNDKSVKMDDGELSLMYNSCSPSIIKAPPRDKSLQLKSVDVAFVLKKETLSKMIRLASMNNLPNLTVIGENGELRIETHEKVNDTSNIASTNVGPYDGQKFSVTFKIENIKMIPDDYNVEISIGAFAKFVNKAGNLTYFIAIETK